MAYTVGIDLGTTNCCIAVVEGGQPVVIPNKRGNLVTPSFFGLDEDDQILIGEIAKRQSVVNPERTFYAIKRLIGRRYDSDEIQTLVKRLPYAIKPSDTGDVEIALGEKTYSPEEISAYILRDLKNAAEEYLNEPVSHVVITVPAYFTDSQRQATIDAGTIAGFDVQRIINEPTAAAISYGFNKNDRKKIAVYDLGGGTFDISILEIGDGLFEVLSTNGDNSLGGEDFDQRLVEHILSKFQEQYGQDLGADKMALQRIKEAAEKAKCELSEREKTEITLPFISRKNNEPVHFQMSLTRSVLNSLVEDLVDKTLQACNNALQDAKTGVAEIDEVILVGGQTKMQLVQKKVKELFQREPCKGVNPDEAVAIGAALQGGIIAGEVKDLILLDVISHSFGLETDNGRMTWIVQRNTAIPFRASRIFTTVEDNQRSVQIHVLQGENHMAADNLSLGRFELIGILPAMRGVPKIEVTFDIDTDGIIHVTARDIATGREQGIQITGRIGLSQTQIQEMAQNIHRTSEEAGLVRSDEPVAQLEMVLKQCKEFLDLHQEYLLVSEREEVQTIIDNAAKVLAEGDEQEIVDLAKQLRTRLLYMTSYVEKD